MSNNSAPASGRTARKRRQTRDRLAAAAFELFERHGYEAVTMEQIAVHADVARGTLYNHFPVREAVLAHWLHAQLAKDLPALMHQVMARDGFAARLATLLEVSTRWWEAHRQYAAPYIRHRFQEVGGGPAEQPSSDMITIYARLIADAQSTGELRQDEPPSRLAHYLHYLYLCALMGWLGDPEASLRDEIARAMAFFMAGARAR